jgi:excisionase family DNA binding protein
MPAKKSSPEVWITKDEAAAMFDVHPKTIDRYARQGWFQAYRVGTRRHVLFKKSEVEAKYNELMTPQPIPAGE